MTCKVGAIDACTASKLANYSSVVGQEITSITDAIINQLKKTNACTGNCITIDNGTPMTYNGIIRGVVVIDGGAGYFPVVPDAEVIGDGTGAEVELTIVDGKIIGVDVTNVGSGYTTANITITETYGTGAIFDINVLGGEVISVTVVDGGSDYEPIYPEVILDYFGNGTGAELVATVNLDTGAIAFVNVVSSGSDYSLDTVAYVVASEFSGGTGAELRLDISGCRETIIDSSIYYNYIIGQSDKCSASSHINQIKSHFRSLGYSIRAMVNPDTNSTIMWEVCWC